jgi:hypothetical protein
MIQLLLLILVELLTIPFQISFHNYLYKNGNIDKILNKEFGLDIIHCIPIYNKNNCPCLLDKKNMHNVTVF